MIWQARLYVTMCMPFLWSSCASPDFSTACILYFSSHFAFSMLIDHMPIHVTWSVYLRSLIVVPLSGIIFRKLINYILATYDTDHISLQYFSCGLSTCSFPCSSRASRAENPSCNNPHTNKLPCLLPFSVFTKYHVHCVMLNIGHIITALTAAFFVVASYVILFNMFLPLSGVYVRT